MSSKAPLNRRSSGVAGGRRLQQSGHLNRCKTLAQVGRSPSKSLQARKRQFADTSRDFESDSEEDSDLETPLVRSKTEGEELCDDVDLKAAIEAGLNPDKKRGTCIPGVKASKMFGPQLVQCDGCGPRMGFNPLFYLICFLVFGIVVLSLEYKKDQTGL